ncbi:MAG: amidohydrolase family protein, partial [Nitrospirota bacterium]
MMVFTGSTGSQDRNDYLVKAGWIYRPDSGLSEGVSVLVHGGIIEAIIDSADINTDLLVIDHTSDIIVPSFCDYHVHFFDKDLKDSRASSNAINDSGISLVYEGGSTSLAGIDAIDMFEPNMTIKACGYAISKKGGYGGYLGKDVGSIDEAMELIDDLNKKGVDYIKVINSGIVDFETGEITAGGFESEELKKLIAYAGSFGLEVFCHANGDNAIRDAIVAGAKAIIHGFMISDDSIGMMKENNVIFIPTIAA